MAQCSDCRSYKLKNGSGYCKMWGSRVVEHDFCSMHKRNEKLLDELDEYLYRNHNVSFSSGFSETLKYNIAREVATKLIKTFSLDIQTANRMTDKDVDVNRCLCDLDLVASSRKDCEEIRKHIQAIRFLLADNRKD